ncbi:Autotransporter-associated beta strand repeat [Flavobacteriaceae bacterium]
MRTSIQNTFHSKIISFKLLFVMLLFSAVSWGQNNSASFTTLTSGAAWFTTGNWNTSLFAGAKAINTSNTNIATFTSTSAPIIGINMGTSSLSLGAISIDATKILGFSLGDSSATAGSLALFGATVNSIPNVIIRNAGTGLFTLQASQTGTMGVIISNATDNIINTDNTGGVTISSIISGVGNLTKAGSGTGVLTLSGVNTYSGKTTVTAGELRLNPSGNNSLSGTCVLNGGTLSTTGITSTRTITFGSIDILNNSTLALLASTNHTITFTSKGIFTSGKTLTVTGWTGSYVLGTTGAVTAAGKVFIGNSASLSASDLTRIRFYNGTNYYAATQLSSGEIVPTTSLVISNISNQTAGVGFSVTVSTKDLDGNLRSLPDATGITLTTATGGTIGGTTTGTISAVTSSVAISGVTLTAGLSQTITATRSSGDKPIAATSNAFDVTSSTPTITLTPAALTGFTYVFGSGPSTEQTFNASGTNLTADISIVAPTDYEISTGTGGSFAALNPITLTHSGGTVSSTPIYVRLKAGLSVANYNLENITTTSAGSNNPTVACSGSVTAITPTITISTGTLSGFTYVLSYGPSAEQTYTVSGANLSADITITPATNYEISLTTGTGFGSTITLARSGVSVSLTTIYVRLKAGLSVASYNSETIAATSAGSNNPTVACSGSVTAGSSTCFSENFVSASAGDNTSTTNQGSVWTANSNFTSISSVFQAGGAVKLGTGTSIGSLTSGSLSGVSGDVTVSFDVKGWTTLEGSINVTLNGSTQNVTYAAVMAGSFETKTLSFTSVPANSTLIIATSAKRAFIDNVTISCSAACTPPSNPSGSITGTTPACGSTTLSYSGTASNPVVNYWQTTATGVSKTNNASSTLAVSASASYYVRAYNAPTNCWSSSAVGPYAVVINTAPTISANPVASSIADSANTSFGVTASGTGITYQWQVDTGSGFSNLSNATPYTTVTSATLNITGATFSMNGYNYRCVVSGTSPCTAATSTSALLTVAAPIPEINIKQGTTNYLTGSSIYAFGNVVQGVNSQVTFTIENLGTANLTITSSTIGGTGFSITTNPVSPVSVSGTTPFVITFTPTGIGAFSGSITIANNDSNESSYVINFTGTGIASSASDVIAIVASETTSIASTINNPAPLTSSTGVQVWQFKVRDGGATLNDSDTLPTILTGFNLAQGSGNSVSTWSDAIQTIALFDGTTFIATGTFTATQIQFSGLNISVADNTEKSLSLRLSLKCPLGADAFDGEDFVYSLSNANTTFSALGSGKTTFAAQISANSSNVISVVAIQLAFEVQPITTGVNNPMSPSVKVKATDSCGNLDLGFIGNISITSSGTLATTTVTATAISGIATFSLTHTVFGMGYFLYANATGLTGITSTTFDIYNITILQPGDIAILAFNTGIAIGGDDEISFVTLVDISPETRIDITDNAYQKCGTANGWGISEGWIRIERKNTILTKGTIVTVRVDNTGTPYIYSPDPTNWISVKPQPTSQGSFNLNNLGEQIFFMSGGSVGGTNAITPTSDGGTYSGNFLFGFNTKGNVWTPTCANSDGGGTQNSDKPLNFDCYLTWPTAQADLNKYTGLLTPATKREWIVRINNPTNWTGYADNAAYDAGPNYYSGSITINTGGFSEGVWIGNSSNNWFECGNWQSLKVPNETVSVVVGSNAVQSAKIDYTALSSDLFSDIAKCYDLTISNSYLEIVGNSANQLQVYGNCNIESGGILDMDDSDPLTTDGQLFLYGNWTNSSSEAAFQEGNGTVHFLGNTTQVINSNEHNNPEKFYNIVLDNNFNTATSNNLIATGNLEIKTNKNFTVAPNDYTVVNKKLTNNGLITIDNNGQLIQVDETDTNDGNYSGTNFKVNRIASINKFDYVYWSSPVDNFNVSNIAGSYKYSWNPIFTNSNGTKGNWTTASGIMTKGKGYIVRAPNSFPIRPATATTLPISFLGKPNNGQFDFGILKGDYNDIEYDAEPSNPNNELTTKYDDNWNLIGNPYPSAIDAEDFLVLNSSKIEGAVWIWKHGIAPNSSTDPFYQNYSNNYSSSDYLKYNGLGSSEPAFNGKIASGQGFMVNMLESAGATNTVSFQNSLRAATHNNSNFFRNATTIEEKSRIWLNIVNSTSGKANTTLVGYSTNSTLGEDYLYDCVFIPEGELAIYSLLNTNPFVIQGRGLPFDSNDTVPIGMKIMANGNHKIAINKIDGLFETSSIGIYLEDKLLNSIHDLRQSPYTFTANIGRIDDRFVLRYSDQALGTPTFEAVANAVLVANKNNQINIQSSMEFIESVTVYDVLGRSLLEKSNIKNNTFVINNLALSNQTLIVKIVLENGQTVTKKIVF